MRPLLEKAIVHLLNEETDKANALFHKFMVERSRQIHESLRQGEDVALSEGWDDEITSEEYFSEGDLDDAEDGDVTDMAADEVAADLSAEDDLGDAVGEVEDAEADIDAVEGDMGDEFGDMGEELPVEDRLESIEDTLKDLTASLEAALAEMNDEDSVEDSELAAQMDTDMGDEDALEDADADLEDADADLKDAEADEKENEFPTDEDEEFDEDDLDDITESVMSELEKISITMTDGKEVGTGKTISGNNKSPLPMEKVEKRTGAKPVTIKSKDHNGYERETAPTVNDMKARKNTKKRAEDGRTVVPAGGDKSAVLNKDYAGGPKATKSVLDGGK